MERTPSTASKERSPSGGLAGGHFSMVARVSSTVVWIRITQGSGALSRAHVTAGRTSSGACCRHGGLGPEAISANEIPPRSTEDALSLSIQDLVDPAVGSHGGRVTPGRDGEQRHLPDGLALDALGEGLAPWDRTPPSDSRPLAIPSFASRRSCYSR